MADKKKVSDDEVTLADALKQEGALTTEDALKASKARIVAHNAMLVAAGAVNGTTGAAPSGSVSVGGTATGVGTGAST